MNWKLEKQKKMKIERKTNKGMNKQQQPDSGTHDTVIYCPHVYQVSTL